LINAKRDSLAEQNARRTRPGQDVGYASGAARAAGGSPLGKRSLQIHFGAEVGDTLHAPQNRVIVGYEDVLVAGELQHLPITERRDIDLVTIKADEPTRDQLYAAIKALGEFDGATDA
jgi:hypothetical protein